MTEIVIDLKKGVDENASVYFEKSKKAKKKLPGNEEAISKLKDKLSKLKPKEVVKKIIRKREWFEKFKWFVSSEGFLVIAGRDATTNDIIVKKHAEKGDLVFHTELPGSPFVIVKSEGKKIGAISKKEAAIFCASHSRAWSQGRGVAEVYSVNPDQVKKELGLPKGTFMVYGKREYYKSEVELACGIYNGRVMVGPLSAVKKNCDKVFRIVLGSDKKSDVAKKLKKHLDGVLEEFMQALPPGDAKVVLED